MRREPALAGRSEIDKHTIERALSFADMARSTLVTFTTNLRGGNVADAKVNLRQALADLREIQQRVSKLQVARRRAGI